MTIRIAREILPDDEFAPAYAIPLAVECRVTPGDVGCTWGPPERCREPEGDEVEILSARRADTGEPVTLTDAEAERVVTLATGGL